MSIVKPPTRNQQAQQIAWLEAEVERLKRDNDLLGKQVASWCHTKALDQAEIERLREALEYYVCDAYGQCREVRLKDGSCIHADIGRCGRIAQDALTGRAALEGK